MNHNESINLPQQKQWTKQYCPSVTLFSDDRLLTFFYSCSCSADDFTAAWGSFIPQCHIINKILILVFSLDICKRHGQNKTINCVKILSWVFYILNTWTSALSLFYLTCRADESFKMSFQRSVGYIRIINHVHYKQCLRRWFKTSPQHHIWQIKCHFNQSDTVWTSLYPLLSSCRPTWLYIMY